MVTFRNAGRVGSIAFRRLPSKNRPLQSDQSEAEEPEHSDAICSLSVQSFIFDLLFFRQFTQCFLKETRYVAKEKYYVWKLAAFWKEFDTYLSKVKLILVQTR